VSKLFLIEDDPLMADSLMQRFRLEDMEAACAHTVEEARRWLLNNKCDVVLCPTAMDSSC
jgi:DNA-binding NtrC family response regulator